MGLKEDLKGVRGHNTVSLPVNTPQQPSRQPLRAACLPTPTWTAYLLVPLWGRQS